jgi:hypothetical protein
MTQPEQILQHITDLIRRHAGKPECVEHVVALVEGYAHARSVAEEKEAE